MTDAHELRQLIREVMREELALHYPQQGPRVLRVNAVVEKTGLGKATIYEKERAGEFPSRFKVGSLKTSGYLESEIDSWILAQAEQREGRR